MAGAPLQPLPPNHLMKRYRTRKVHQTIAFTSSLLVQPPRQASTRSALMSRDLYHLLTVPLLVLRSPCLLAVAVNPASANTPSPHRRKSLSNDFNS